MPWGLLVVLGLYAGLVTAYVWATWWNSPGYRAAQSYEAAQAILGVDDGRACSEQDLEQALRLVLEAARLVPEEHRLAEHVERLRWRYEEQALQAARRPGAACRGCLCCRATGGARARGLAANQLAGARVGS